MPNRKKRLEKGIQSISEQIELHEDKLKQAEEQGMIELMEYYEKEITSLRNAKEIKEKQLEKE